MFTTTGGPVGMRMAVDRPERVQAIVVPKIAVFARGGSGLRPGAARRAFWKRPGAAHEAAFRKKLSFT